MNLVGAIRELAGELESGAWDGVTHGPVAGATCPLCRVLWSLRRALDAYDAERLP